MKFGFFISLPNLSSRRLDVYHTSTHGVALLRSRCGHYVFVGFLVYFMYEFYNK